MMKWHVLFAIVCVSIGFAGALLLVSGGGLIVNADCPSGCPGTPGTPCDNGDVNADGELNISDPIYLLSFLFLGDPEPVPISCDPCDPCLPRASALPATCQASCYAIDCNNVLACDNTDFPGQDGFTKAGCAREGRFTDNEDGTLTDTCTELMWTKAAAPNRMTWQEALQYCEDLILCEDGTWTTDSTIVDDHGGVKYDDWRLPNIIELRSPCRFDAAWPDSAFGPEFVLPPGDPNTLADWFYWSSTTYVYYQFIPEYANRAWCINYAGASATINSNKTIKTHGGGRVLAVRGGM